MLDADVTDPGSQGPVDRLRHIQGVREESMVDIGRYR